MQNTGYNFLSNNENYIYTFISEGKRGFIPKLVLFEKLNELEFNLAFGDYDVINATFDDKIVTNNGDTIKVLTTIIQIIKDFFDLNPTFSVYIQGSTPIRTQLYQKIIADNFEEISKLFYIFGIDNEDSLEDFNPQKTYLKFKISKK